MLETVEATIDTLGNVVLSEKIRLPRKQKALVTILKDEPAMIDSEWSLAGSMELIDPDLEAASREISEEINLALEKSAEELRRSYE